MPAPDPLFSLSAERTFLAYVRTGLTLLAAGVAVATALPDAGNHGLRQVLGGALVLLALAVVLGASRRLAQVDAALRRGDPLPRPALARVLVPVLALVAVGALLVVALD